MKKKLLVALLLVVALFAVFANGDEETAAGATNAKAFQVPATGYDGSDVTITFYHTMGTNLSTVLDDYIVEFNKLYPHIHVQWEAIGSYDDVRDQISTQIFVGSQPNIAYCYPDHVALYNMAGAVATLDNLIESKTEVKRADGTTEILGLTPEQKADFIEGYYNEGKQFGDGLMYTMPLSKSTEVLYYNKTFFDQNGIKVPTTWAEMESRSDMTQRPTGSSPCASSTTARTQAPRRLIICSTTSRTSSSSRCSGIGIRRDI